MAKETVEDKFRDYTFRVNWTSSEPYDPSKEVVEVRVTTADEKEYQANFAALGFLDYVFEKNKRTGECGGGTYFCMPNMILVEKISDQSIKATIDDLVHNGDILEYFAEIK